MAVESRKSSDERSLSLSLDSTENECKWFEGKIEV